MRNEYRIKGRLGFNVLVFNALEHLEFEPAKCTQWVLWEG